MADHTTAVEPMDRGWTEYTALRSKLEAEVEHYDERIAACKEGGFPFTTAHAARKRLQAILSDVEGGSR